MAWQYEPVITWSVENVSAGGWVYTDEPYIEPTYMTGFVNGTYRVDVESVYPAGWWGEGGTESESVTFDIAIPGGGSGPPPTGDYIVNFQGLLDEGSGILLGTVSATAYFEGNLSETFTIDNRTVAGFPSIPLYVSFNTSLVRQYWFSNEASGCEVFAYDDDNLASYTITFNDLVGKLKTDPYIELKGIVNGTWLTIEKRKVDMQKQVQFRAVPGRTYRIVIGDITLGDILFTDTNPTLNIRGIEFPETIQVGYQYVQVYAYRAEDGSILALYNDNLDETESLTFDIYYLDNNTLAYTITEVSPSLPYAFEWLMADVFTDYYLIATIEHTEFGTLDYRQILLANLTPENPFSLDVLGNLPFDSSYLVPVFIILATAGVFSAVNLGLGLVLVTVEAAWFAGMGWLPISIDLIVFLFALVIIFVLVMARRR